MASHLIHFLPYARKEEESKAHVVYGPVRFGEELLALLAGALPLVAFLPAAYWPAVVTPWIPFGLLTLLMKRRIQGYTGDCCGALFLLCELTFFLTCLTRYTLS